MQVKPKLALLKRTLLGTGSALAVCAVLLAGLIRSGADADGMYGTQCILSSCLGCSGFMLQARTAVVILPGESKHVEANLSSRRCYPS